ncbi:MAG: TlpA disulfide reductase family protein [Acidobacteriota bacterium]
MSAETPNSPSPATTSSRPFARPIALWLGTSLAVVAALGFGLSMVADALPAVSADRAAAALAAPSDTGDRYPLPNFRLPSLDGPEISPADYPGDVVVIDLWATWCGPCRLQARYLEQLHGEYATGVRFLAINTGESEDIVRRYVERTPFPYPLLLDPSQTVQTMYQASGLPTVFIVDAAGKVSYLNVGVSDPATLRREIEKAQRATAAPTAAGQPTV